MLSGTSRGTAIRTGWPRRTTSTASVASVLFGKTTELPSGVRRKIERHFSATTSPSTEPLRMKSPTRSGRSSSIDRPENRLPSVFWRAKPRTRETIAEVASRLVMSKAIP